MSTEKIIKSKSGWLFLLITIALFAVAALFLANFVLSAIAADRNPSALGLNIHERQAFGLHV